MLRVWDIESCEVLCSSPYVPASASVEHGDALSSPVKRALANALPDEVLRRLCVSDSEDVIAGAYDNGTVRVWGVHSYSISTLRNLLTKHLMNAQLHAQGGANGGTGTGGMFGRKKTLAVGGVGTSGMGDFGANMTLAISPLTLISEWSAHVCPILACKSLSLIATQLTLSLSMQWTTCGLTTRSPPLPLTIRVSPPVQTKRVRKSLHRLDNRSHSKAERSVCVTGTWATTC